MSPHARRKKTASGTPQELVKQRGAASLEEAFISWLQEAAGPAPEAQLPPANVPIAHENSQPPRQGFSLRRLFSYSRREALELRRDPAFNAGADGHSDPDADHGLRHQHGCGEPAFLALIVIRPSAARRGR